MGSGHLCRALRRGLQAFQTQLTKAEAAEQKRQALRQVIEEVLAQ